MIILDDRDSGEGDGNGGKDNSFTFTQHGLVDVCLIGEGA